LTVAALGTLDLILMPTLATMGRQHAYQIASRLEQTSDGSLALNQGSLYPALVRLDQSGWLKGTWGKTENNREAKFYELTRAGRRALNNQTERRRKKSRLIERLLVEGA
jgi:transcriptional regulator